MQFKGILVFHPFGLEDGMSYTKLIELSAGIWLLKRMEEVGNRFWFGQSYRNLMEIECEFFRRRAIDLPIGMLDTQINDRWHGRAGKVLFICPRIRISPYYENIYKKFKNDFVGIPYSIGGAQPIPIEGDKNVLGYLPQKEYDDLYPSHSVMYYHATNKRHVHYHPFEAVKSGLPLVFMAGGLLDELGGKGLPGRCENLDEALRKCRKIVNGDRRLAEKIRASQEVLLNDMSYDYCLEEWKKAIKKIEKDSIAVQNEKRRKMAIILPQNYLGGVLDYTLRFLRILAKGMRKYKMEIVFAVLEEMKERYYKHIKEVEDYGIKIRTFSWEEVTRERIEELTKLLGYPLDIYKSNYTLMNDGIRYFEDCDFMLFMADRVPENLFIFKPYGVIIHDYMRRYIPENLPERFEAAVMSLVRNSECNFTTNTAAITDCIQYVGIKKEKIHLLPFFFENISNEEIQDLDIKEGYFVWSTNISRHKNHKMALEALSTYYQAGGILHCYVTGVNTDLFADCSLAADRELTVEQRLYVQEISDIVAKDLNLPKYIHFEGQLSKKRYYGMVKGAKFMMHPGQADNGNGSVVDAAFLGVPSISSDYAAMRNIDQCLKLGLLFFNKDNSEQLREMLFYAEQHWEEMKINLPTINELAKHTVEDENLCEQIQKIIVQNMHI